MQEKKELSTAILEQKKAPNKLLVEEALNDDNSSVQLSKAKMAELRIFKGDTVFIKGKKHKETLAVALVDSKLQETKIRMNETVRKNLRVSLGDVVQVRNAEDVPILTKIHVLPLSDTIEGISGNLTKTYLNPYFGNFYRPVKKGDLFIVRGSFKSVEFKIVATEPTEFGVVAPNTLLNTEGEPINRKDEENVDDGIGDYQKEMGMRKMIELPLRPLKKIHIEKSYTCWEDIGGLQQTIKQLQEIILSRFEHAEKSLFGMMPPKGVLFYGPTGCGKTLLIKTVANFCNGNFIQIKGSELLAMHQGKGGATVRGFFDRARSSAPCVLFFDELDSISIARGSSHGGADDASRVISQLLTEIDKVEANTNILVVGATNRPEIIDKALIRPGRFDQLIYIPLPDTPSRLGILRANLRKTLIAKDVDLNYISQITDGFSGADITEICQKAAKAAVRDSLAVEASKKALIEQGSKAQNFNPIPEITRKHFQEALKSAYRSVTSADLHQFEQFISKFNPSFMSLTSNKGPSIKWPTAATEANKSNEDDDLYG